MLREDARRVRAMNGKCIDHDGRHVVHDGREHGRDETGTDGRGKQSLFAGPLKDFAQFIRQAHIAKAINNDVHADGEDNNRPRCAFHKLPGVDIGAPPGKNMNAIAAAPAMMDTGTSMYSLVR